MNLNNYPKVIEKLIIKYLYQLIDNELEENMYCDNCILYTDDCRYKIHKECKICERFLCDECYGENNIKEDTCDECFEKKCF
jgi:hypothetical protein